MTGDAVPRSEESPLRPPATFERLGYRPALDGIRAVAIALVLFDHAALFVHHRSFVFPQNGIMGVDLFFVLSGFLITTLLLEEHDRRGRISFRGFYARRARRLLPALVVLLAVALVAAGISAAVHHVPWRFYRELLTTGYALGFVTNIAVVWANSSVAFGMGHLWSLATEDQFYLLWPLALAVVARFRPWRAAALLGIVLIAEILREIQLYYAHPGYTRIGIAPDTRSGGIIVGCLLAVLLRTRLRDGLIGIARLGAPAVVLALVLLLGLPLSDPEKFVGGTVIFAVIAALLLAGALDSRSLLAKVLAIGPVVYLGRISYSLYLWHYPIFYSLRFGYGTTLARWEGIGISVAVAVASYHFVELPFLRRTKPPLHLFGRPIRRWAGQAQPVEPNA